MRVAQIKHNESLSKENDCSGQHGQKMFHGGHQFVLNFGREIRFQQKELKRRGELGASWQKLDFERQAKAFGLDPAGNEEALRNCEWGKMQSRWLYQGDIMREIYQ